MVLTALLDRQLVVFVLRLHRCPNENIVRAGVELDGRAVVDARAHTHQMSGQSRESVTRENVVDPNGFAARNVDDALRAVVFHLCAGHGDDADVVHGEWTVVHQRPLASVDVPQVHQVVTPEGEQVRVVREEL